MKFPVEIDVAIVGTGPAGSCAARALAQAGISTALIEKETLPRYKTCGGGILWRAGRLLGDCPWQHVVEHQAHQVELNLLDSGTQFTARRPVPLVCMTMRSDFDHALVQHAQQAGAQLFDACTVQHLEDRGNFVQLTTNRGPLRAQWVIGADGVRGIVARAGGWQELCQLVPALEWEVRVSPEDFARLSQMARFDFDLPAHGYAWVFPKRDHLSIGVLDTQRGGNININAACKAYLQRLGIGQVVDIARHGYVIPTRPRTEGFSRGRLLLVGDAAGLADPVTAEGITHAIRSGQLAAAAIIEGRNEAAMCRRIYAHALQQEILSELKHAAVLARILYHHPRQRTWLMKRYGQGFTEVMADIMLGERRYAQVLREPLNYLKLLYGH